ncbi:MAG: ABC transporter permease, partial [Acidimicrobiia bacterium]|nr:ABC transporter permease [Acidimicrobiia bacterium]
MQLFLQRLIDGTANGVLYGASALALVVVYRASGRLNLAQGELATVGTYVSLVLGTPATPALFGTTFVGNWIAFSPWPLWAGIVGGMIVAAALAAVIERFVVRRIPETSARTAVSVSIGLLLLINSLIVYFWKNAPRGYPSPFPDAPDDYFGFFGARLRYTTLMTWAVLLAVLGILNLVLRVSKAGLAFRAVSSNPAASRLVGINTGRVLAGGWALAAALGTLCGGLLISRLVLRPGVLTQLLIYSFAAATIGGLTSLGGALVGGLIVGISITMIGAYVPFVGTSMALPAVLVLMVVMLLVRPSGLFGTVGIDGGPATTTRLLGGGSDAGPDASAARFVLVRGTSRWRIVRLVGVVAVLAGAVLPAVVLPFVEARLWTDVLIYAIALAGLYLLMGPGGQLSLGHGAFVGVGAYATAVSITRWGWPHLAGLALGFVICLVIGLAVGLPALRIKGQYLALVTLAFAVAFPGVIERFAWLTGGGQGPAP